MSPTCDGTPDRPFFHVTAPALPRGAWDTHVHCWDPEHFPFASDRAYTPKPATWESLVANVTTDGIMIVQASIEQGIEGLLSNLKRIHQECPLQTIRGTISGHPAPGRQLHDKKNEAFDEMHKAGVRCIRLHGSYGGAGNDLDWARAQLRMLASLYPVRVHGWSISAQLPLDTWASLKEFLEFDPVLDGISLVAEHNGTATPRDVGTPAMESFVELLRSGRLNVKISALHRRSPEDLQQMEPIIRSFAEAAPQSLLWGSDWPHCDTSKSRLEPANHLAVDTDLELKIIRKWMTDEEWMAMMVTNPQRLFG